MHEISMFIGGFVGGAFCTLICCLINGNDEDSMPLAVATETEVDSDQVTIYDMRPAYSSDEEDL